MTAVRGLFGMGALSAAMLLAAPLAQAVPVYGTSADLTGTRTNATSGGGLVGSNAWANTDPATMTLDWNITNNMDGTWDYTYTWSGSLTDRISHFTVDVTDDCANDQTGCARDVTADGSPLSLNTGYEFGTFFFGSDVAVKFDTSALEYSFTSDRDPVWGDLCLVDGAGAGGGGSDTCADLVLGNDGFATYSGNTALIWNEGFGNRTSENSLFYVARPNGGGTPPEQIPAPGVVALFGIGLLGLGFATRRRPEA